MKNEIIFQMFSDLYFSRKNLVLNHGCFSTFRQQYCFSSSASSYPNRSFFCSLKYIFLSLSKSFESEMKIAELLICLSSDFPIFLCLIIASKSSAAQRRWRCSLIGRRSLGVDWGEGELETVRPAR